MTIKTSFLTIQGAPLEGENPLPVFRSRRPDTDPVDNGTLKPEELAGFGTATAFRVLPYRMQDRYCRKKQLLEIPSILLENDLLRAEFLPTYGGRLYSLREKKTGRELLYRNPVMQPANLAIRNAWFSGGIEWNIAQMGHTYSTSDSVFFARVTTEDGYEFLRMYDYERTKGLLWQIDFHLPDGSSQLCAHVVIINDTPHDVPMYWWTNIAVREEPGCRVFSETKEVIYIEPSSLNSENSHAFGHGTLPKLPVLPEKDASYPEHFHFSCEYFFQNPKELPSPWEAITYSDGTMFYERSTQPLRIRKMFCWGNHTGGRNWCDYLSVPGKGNYLEIQAGLSPTQLHTTPMKAQSTISFTQCFGSLLLEPGYGNLPDYEMSRKIIRTAVDGALSSDEVERRDLWFHSLSILPCTKILHVGTGWGALEQMRRMTEELPLFPRQFQFSPETISGAQQDFLALLMDLPLSALSGGSVPEAFLTDTAYLPYLKKRLSAEPDHVTALLLTGILLYENGSYEQAADLWQRALTYQDLPILWRSLACKASQDGDPNLAADYMRRAHLENYPEVDRAYYAEFFRYLLETGQYREVCSIYQSLSKDLKEAEVLILATCEAAIEVDDFDFLEWAFTRDFALIREGETRLVDIWYSYAEKKGIEKTALPKHLDLRLSVH